eukprot:CAMPEP_0204171910 /NCGR_PEP_ID=MMETSP0361-20130328/43655_1 /ASSEMBLY_ACC=CAM_ASM_000343 /TAXON_ID=268821 /ORGANISM="Scrippsiella Hangoei, Strain SHTV-5" /LENGTH=70 /DNA_ID=CAMNT_0051129911 /DNA_START=216 /DNA_END=426 /DNA_ORIENTATION=+
MAPSRVLLRSAKELYTEADPTEEVPPTLLTEEAVVLHSDLGPLAEFAHRATKPPALSKGRPPPIYGAALG